MKELVLTRGCVSILDDEDYQELARFQWYAEFKASGAYGVRDVYSNDGKRTSLKLHREVTRLMGVSIPDGYHVDHINHDTLDNRRFNLRVASCQENSFNSQKHLVASSRFKGVCWSKQKNRWRSYIVKDGKQKSLGLYQDELEAAKAYNQAAFRLFGEFAHQNDLTLGYSR